MVREWTTLPFEFALLRALKSLSFLRYRAMHDGAKRRIAIVCCLSVRPSVCDVDDLRSCTFGYFTAVAKGGPREWRAPRNKNMGARQF